MLHNSFFAISLIWLGKSVSLISRILGRGAGTTWPGHIALQMDHAFIRHVTEKNPQTKIILVTGTNGKTTTSLMIAKMLERGGYRVYSNQSGANLLNGMASGLILASEVNGRVPYDFLIFEIDENMLPLMVAQVEPAVIVCLNLFRDQLDRYGELMSIAQKWRSVFHALKQTTIVLNADDPLVAWLGEGQKNVVFFGLSPKDMQEEHIAHGADSIYCPNCGTKLTYHHVSYSHIGDWECRQCGLKKTVPTYSFDSFVYPLAGLYNRYNVHAAASVACVFGVPLPQIAEALADIKPAFGRQERLMISGKQVEIILSKNPTGTNQSMATVVEIARGLPSFSSSGEKDSQANRKGPVVLFVLNDRYFDGTDVSWIWDTNAEKYVDQFRKIIVSGDRTYDMALRIAYATENYELRIKNQETEKLIIRENLSEAIAYGLSCIEKDETLFILPTYSAMLEVRKVLTGRSIL